MKGLLILAFLSAGCGTWWTEPAKTVEESLDETATFRHPITGVIRTCTGSPWTSPVYDVDRYGRCKTAAEAAGYVRQR
jgi:hypothetical protein